MVKRLLVGILVLHCSNYMDKRRYTQSGFTLIELIVVVGIVAVMSSLVLVQFGAGNNDAELQNAELLLETDLRTTLSWAQSGRKCCSGSAPNGYGVITTVGDAGYQIYAEFNGDNMYTSGGSTDQIVETISFTDEQINDVVISDCIPLFGTTGYCDMYIDMPSGDIYTNGNQIADLAITLEHDSTGDTVVVVVDNTSASINSQ